MIHFPYIRYIPESKLSFPHHIISGQGSARCKHYIYLDEQTVDLEGCIMLFMQISKHSHESCPLNSEKAMKAVKNPAANLNTLTKKHDVKLAGAWYDGANYRFIML